MSDEAHVDQLLRSMEARFNLAHRMELRAMEPVPWWKRWWRRYWDFHG